VVTDLCRRLWEVRDDVVADNPIIPEAMDIIMASPQKRPYVLGDVGDRVVAGAPGDSTAILSYLLEHNLSLKAAIPITDPDAVSQATAAGLGAEITLNVGGRYSSGFEPILVTGKVVHLRSGDEPAIGGDWGIDETGNPGSAAVLQVKNVLLLLTTRSASIMFPTSFRCQGIQIEALDFLVVKSGVHFKHTFRHVAEPMCVDTPGLTVFRPEDFPFRLARPIYPLDKIDYEPREPQIFHAGSTVSG
jgi:microcystin degradation protein MlrC